MQYIGLISSSASGKAGGLVASHGRAGSQLRAHSICRQVRTPSATLARAITGGLPGLWRQLTPAEQQTWAQLATTLPSHDALGQAFTLSGYALYIACNRRLITIGITAPLTSAPARPSIPAITGFSAAPEYNNPSNPTGLFDIQLSTAAPLPSNFTPLLRASAAVSPARANIRPSELRVIEAGVPWTVQPHSALIPWKAIYGSGPPSGTITFALSLVDPISGLVGAEVRARTAFAFNTAAPPTAGTLIIKIEGQTIAGIPAIPIEIGGEIVAN